MNVLKMTAFMLSLTMVAGLFTGCNRSSVRTERVEETPYGESYVKEKAPEGKQIKKHEYGEELEKKAGDVEQSVKKSSEEVTEKTEKAVQGMKQPFEKKKETSSKETYQKTKRQ